MDGLDRHLGQACRRNRLCDYCDKRCCERCSQIVFVHATGDEAKQCDSCRADRQARRSARNAEQDA